MRKFTIVFLIIAAALTTLSISNYIQAQSAAKIENIKFDAEGSKLAITYDIAKYKEGETFEIWVKIVTASGKTLIPVTMYGDVNKGVSGGTGKRIVWDIEADNVTIDEEFSVEVYGRVDSKSSTQVANETVKGKTAKYQRYRNKCGRSAGAFCIASRIRKQGGKRKRCSMVIGCCRLRLYCRIHYSQQVSIQRI